MEQRIIGAERDYADLDAWIKGKHVFLVCGVPLLDIGRHLQALEEKGASIVRFSDFQPNPRYESVEKAVALFREKGCDAIMAIGGGSAMDVAKCVKLYSNMEPCENYLKQQIIPNGIPFLAVPTTAGSGSEATRFAVIYYQGVKQSVGDISCIPDTVLLDSGVLASLPLYQKKATMLDALCHAIESWWSVRSTEESKAFSREATRRVLENWRGYLENTEEGNRGMLLAANTAGKAINITQTTAGHAMCYKITGLFGCAHGHAAALCVRKLFPWIIAHADRCIDPRGKENLLRTLEDIADALGCADAAAAAERFELLFDSLELSVPTAAPEQYRVLQTSVNPERLRNNPVELDAGDIDILYHQILKA